MIYFRRVMTKMLNCSLDVIGFELQLHYVHFKSNIIEKCINLLSTSYS